MVIFMAKRIKISKSKYSESFSVIDDFTDPQTKKRSTFIVERLGSLKSLMEKYNTDSRDVVLSKLNDYVNTLKEQDKIEKAPIPVYISPEKLIPFGEERLYNLGYLYPRNILSSLGIKTICDDISQRHQFKFDLYNILMDLVCTRIIYPGSKRSSYKDAHHFLDVPQYQLEDIYRSLPVLAEERYFIESELYKNSRTAYKRDCSILYYDCTNFYFEAEEENGMKKYGKSKENRPNPIVQYGLFMDTDGIPIADIVFDGNKNEQFSMREIESEIEKDFGLSRFIVCADAGLNGWENKIYNDRKKNGAFIVTQPIKKLKKSLKDWATSNGGWKILGHSQIFNIDNLKDTIEIDGIKHKTMDVVFYKERWEKTIKKAEQLGRNYTLEEHIIVTFSPRFQKYQKKIRDKKLERARKLLKNPGKIGVSNQRDPRYYIKSMTATKDGEVADEKYYFIDEDKIKEEEKYDGFYAVATDLEDKDISLVINANKQRWEIEESFEIMKSELRTRPIYVSLDETIQGHLLTCFMALMIYRILEKKYLSSKYTCCELIDTLREMNITHIGGNNYIPSFKRTEITDDLAEIFGFQPAREILTQKYLKKFTKVVNSKKSTKMNLTKKKA